VRLNVGVDVGGTKIAACAVDEQGAVVHRSRRETPAQDVGGILAAVADAAGDLVEQAREAGNEVGAVGVACAGLVDAEGSTVLFAPNLAWRDEPLQERLQEMTGLPVVLENDANAAAWGEFRFGAAADVDDMLLITVGTGVGGGIITQDLVLRGAHGIAAEIGHLRVVPNGHRCGCGNRGCFEQYASGKAMQRVARELLLADSPYAAGLAPYCDGDPARVEGWHVTHAARAGDQAAGDLIRDIARWLGTGLANLAAALDPGLIVVGGGVSEASDLLLPPTREAFARQLTGRGHRPVAPIVAAHLGASAGLVGAADLIRTEVAQ
jgi:glucokinase